MIDRGIPNERGDWPEGVLDSLREWEQGDIVRDPPFHYFADPERPIWEATGQYSETSTGPEVIIPDAELCPPYGMVTTQTCDIAEEDRRRPLRPWVQIAPVYEVTTWKRPKLEGRGPLYWVLIRDLPGQHPYVADLRIEVPVEKSWLAQQERIVGFGDEAEKRRVGEKIATLRGRPAFARELSVLLEAVDDLFGSVHAEEIPERESVLSAVEEVALFLDSYLHPTSVQIVFLTVAPLDGESLEWLAQWRDGIGTVLADVGVTLQAHDVRDLESCPAGDYRRMVVIWHR